MNRRARTLHGLGLVALISSAMLAGGIGVGIAADATLAVGLAPGSRLWLDGSSNVHDFQIEATQIDLTAARDSAAIEPNDVAGLEGLVRAGGLKAFDLSIPVAAMHSHKEGLDENMRKALKAAANPTIRFNLVRYEPSASGNADSVGVHVTGTLSIAGTERPIDLLATMSLSGDAVVFEGTQPVLMSDFGVKPPKMMLGTLRTHDQVIVHYRLLLAEKSPAGDSSVERKEQP